MVGELLKCLKDHGLTDDTLIIFTSDNGAMLNRGGRDAVLIGHKINGDLLGFKFGIWEGGHRVPFIARWPGRIPAGTTSDQLLGQIDMLATFLALTGRDHTALEGKDSINMLPALLCETDQQLRTELVIAPRREQNLGIRMGKWMYIGAQGSGGFGGSKPQHHAWGGPAAIAFVGSINSDIKDNKLKPNAPPAQLYELENDVFRTMNLYHEHPDIVEQMRVRLSDIRSEQP